MSLVEASAGTGKTHAITTLVVRALLEEPVALSQILVLTYTRAATAELRVRVRQRIIDALRVIDGSTTSDADLSEVIRHSEGLGEASPRTVLLQALDATDRAPIHTIHGFCQRLLSEFPIEFGVEPEVDIIQNDWPLRRQLATDFWIKELDEAPRWLIAELQRRAISIETLADLGALTPGVPVLGPPPVAADAVMPIDELQRARQRVLENWKENRREISELLLQSASLNRNRYRRASVDTWLSELDLILQEDAITMPGWFGKFTQEGVEAGTKRGQEPPEHSFFALCSELAAISETGTPIADAAVFDIQRRFIDLAQGTATRRLEDSQLLTYDDLVRAVHRGLTSDNGAQLARALRERYPLALVDEFQDTDEHQYDIFRRIYGADGTAVFVGDPKQAIYAFRGADVFSYLRAAKQTNEARYTMQQNWRSVPRMVQATNALFGGVAEPFVVEGIAFRATTAARNVAGAATDGIDIVDVPVESGKRGVSRRAALAAIPGAVASEALGLLSGPSACSPQDIAVLCRTNAQASEIASALRDCEVPVSLDGDLCVFDTATAAEVEIMLHAIDSPTSTRALKRLLFTHAIGFTAQQIVELDEDDGWMPWQIRALRWNEVAKSHGVGHALKALFVDTDVERNLAVRHDGRRTLTDLHHLHELIHRVEHRERLDLAGTLRWLRDARGAARARNELPAEELQQRPDGSTNSVKVTTIHKSKGLEYGVVILPYAWLPPWISQQEQRTVRFHDPTDDYSMKLDLGSVDRESNVELAKNENFAESVRLLYVAITRARSRCVILLPKVDDWHRSSLGYLLQGWRDLEDSRQFDDLVERSEGAVTIRGATPRASIASRDTLDPASLVTKPVERQLRPSSHVTSFTELQSQASHGVDGLARASLEPHLSSDFADPSAPLAALPSGARTGLLIHDVLERIRWNEISEPETENLVRAQLLDHGFSTSLTEPLIQSLAQVGAVPLFKGGPSLASIPHERQVRELEFTLRLGSHEARAHVSAAWEKHATDPAIRGYAKQIREIEESSLRRFLRGFVDLVFEHEGRWYVVDYKTNLLPAYTRSDLQETMLRHHYVLQYHLYTIAVDSYLRQRIKGFSYDEHFGGAHFLFLRGMSTPGHGIFGDRPAAALIDAVGTALGGSHD